MKRTSSSPTPEFIGRSMADIAVRSQRLVNDWLKRQTQEGSIWTR